MFAIDLSNWGGKLTSDVVNCWREEDIEKVIVGVDLGHLSLARQQLEIVNDGGLRLDIYRFTYWGTDPLSTLKQVAWTVDGLPIGRIWLDFEDEDASQNPEQVCVWIADYLDVAENLFPGRVGLYTAAWWWKPFTGNSERFRTYPLWVAQYDGQANLELVPFGGWTHCVMKQYTGSTTVCSYTVDRNFEEDNMGMTPEEKKTFAISDASVKIGALVQQGKWQEALDILTKFWGMTPTPPEK